MSDSERERSTVGPSAGGGAAEQCGCQRRGSRRSSRPSLPAAVAVVLPLPHDLRTRLGLLNVCCRREGVVRGEESVAWNGGRAADASKCGRRSKQKQQPKASMRPLSRTGQPATCRSRCQAHINTQQSVSNRRRGSNSGTMEWLCSAAMLQRRSASFGRVSP